MKNNPKKAEVADIKEEKKTNLEKIGNFLIDGAKTVFGFIIEKEKVDNEKKYNDLMLKETNLNERLQNMEKRNKELEELLKNKDKEDEDKKTKVLKGMKEWNNKKTKLIEELLNNIDCNLIKKILENKDLKPIKEEDIENELSKIINENLKDNPIIVQKYSSIFQSIKNNIKEIQTLNFMMAGYTGAGKSSLTNAILKINDAKEGHNIDPETDAIKQYSNENEVPGITIYDTIGVEDTNVDRNLLKIKKEIKVKFEEYLKDPKKSLHGIIYCIKNGISDNRILDGEINFIKELNKLYGDGDILIIAFTQSTNTKKKTEDRKKQLREKLNNDNIEMINVLVKNCNLEVGDQIIEVKAFGLDKLIDAMKNKCKNQLVKYNIKQIAKEKIKEKYLSDTNIKSEEILQKLEKYEFENTFNEECKYILKYLIGDLNLNFENLDNIISIKIEESKKYVKNKILEENKSNWNLKLLQEFKILDTYYDKQLDDPSITNDLMTKFNDYFKTKIEEYIYKNIFRNASILFTEKIKNKFTGIICENIKDEEIEDLVNSNIDTILKKIDKNIN